MGWAIIPLHDNSKIPNLPKGHSFLTEAPTDDDYKSFKFENYGIVTGQLSDIVVLDVDEEGFETLADKGLFDFPTPQVETPNGLHLYFKYNPAVRTNAGKIGEGVDVRANGAYVVGPGSEVDGVTYSWKEGYGLEDFKLAEAPKWMYEGLYLETPKPDDYYSIPGIVGEGNRNSTCHKLACYFVNKEMPSQMVWDMVSHFNRNWVRPPLDDEEVERLCESAEKYRGQ